MTADYTPHQAVLNLKKSWERLYQSVLFFAMKRTNEQPLQFTV
jgi:hypothetical protein